MEKSMQILISSNVNYYQKTLSPLLNSLSASGCPSGSITVVVGGVTDSLSGSFDCNVVGVSYNSFDYTPLIWQAEQKIKPEFVFLLHDTTTVSASFWNSINNIKEMTRLIPRNSMNMGIYPTAILPLMLPFLKMITTKEQAMYNEDFIFDRKPFCKSFGTKKILAGMDDFYKTGELRQIEIYPDSGITKYRANYGKQSRPIINL